MKCSECGSEMRLIPAGVSKKTGKPYQSFYACEDRECGKTLPAETIKKQEPKKDRDYDKENRGKVRMNFAKIAYEQNKVLSKALVTEIEVWVDYVMKGKLE